MFLSEFDFALAHRSGKSSGKPDALSRRADHDDGSNDNVGMTLLKPEWFVWIARRQGHVEAVSGMDQLLPQMRQMEEDSEWKSWKHEHSANCKEEQGLLKYKGKVYVQTQFRTQVMKAHHDATDAGHPGQDKTLELITWNYWWPTM